MAWAPDYATASELRAYVRVTDPDDDPWFALAVTAASRAIDRFCNRQFGQTDSVEQRTFETSWSRSYGRYKADTDDIATLTGLVVTVAGNTVAAANYTLYPLNANQNGEPWRRIMLDAVTSPARGTGPATVLIDATFGWAAVPDTIKQATLLQGSKFFADRNAPFGIAGSAEFGSEMRLLSKLHPDVQLQLTEYRRDWPLL